MTTEAPVHYRIYVYTAGHMPPAEPVGVSLCPAGRRSAESLVGALSQVTCASCWQFIREIGLDRPDVQRLME